MNLNAIITLIEVLDQLLQLIAFVVFFHQNNYSQIKQQMKNTFLINQRLQLMASQNKPKLNRLKINRSQSKENLPLIIGIQSRKLQSVDSNKKTSFHLQPIKGIENEPKKVPSIEKYENIQSQKQDQTSFLPSKKQVRTLKLTIKNTEAKPLTSQKQKENNYNFPIIFTQNNAFQENKNNVLQENTNYVERYSNADELIKKIVISDKKDQSVQVIQIDLAEKYIQTDLVKILDWKDESECEESSLQNQKSSQKKKNEQVLKENFFKKEELYQQFKSKIKEYEKAVESMHQLMKELQRQIKQNNLQKCQLNADILQKHLELEEINQKITSAKLEETEFSEKLSKIKGYVSVQENILLRREVQEYQEKQQALFNYAQHLKNFAENVENDASMKEIFLIKRQIQTMRLAYHMKIFDNPNLDRDDKCKLLQTIIDTVHEKYYNMNNRQIAVINRKTSIIEEFTNTFTFWAGNVVLKRQYFNNVKKEYTQLSLNFEKLLASLQSPSELPPCSFCQSNELIRKKLSEEFTKVQENYMKIIAFY